MFRRGRHIGLAAVSQNRRSLVMVDLNPAACTLAVHNIAAAGMGDRVEVRQGRIDEMLEWDERFSVIIADPPWVPTADIVQFPQDPTIAIDGGADGLDLARTACAVIHAHLAIGGSAVLQLGSSEQVDAMDVYLDRDLGSDLGVAEVRHFDRGVLVRLER
ncbi:methyltransferase [Aeromicrobium sp. UC242_57]|uniref:methyltransferase n=1 Tax=Aeromicrobium sp. UC242_57 TaxID=3374624 RepID=UPI0037883325